MNPRLLHPILVSIRQIQRSNTPIMDTDLHEPVGQALRDQKPVQLYAQVKEMEDAGLQVSVGGRLENANGYLLFLTSDLHAQGISLQIGDRVVQVGEELNARFVDWYFVKFQHRGHYPSAKGATIVKAWFADRQPVKVRK